MAAPIIGSTKMNHLDEAAAALSIDLSPEDVNYLEELYVPHKIIGALDENPAEGTVLIDEKK